MWFVAGCIISGSYSISYLEATLAGHLYKVRGIIKYHITLNVLCQFYDSLLKLDYLYMIVYINVKLRINVVCIPLIHFLYPFNHWIRCLLCEMEFAVFWQLGIGTVSVSLMFLIPPTLYAITSPVWGWVSDSKVTLQKPYNKYTEPRLVLQSSSIFDYYKTLRLCILKVHVMLYSFLQNYVVSLVTAGALLTSIFFFTLGPSPLFSFLPL